MEHDGAYTTCGEPIVINDYSANYIPLFISQKNNHHSYTPPTIVPLSQLGELWDLCVERTDVIVGNEGHLCGGLGSKQELKKRALSTAITESFNHLKHNKMYNV